MNSLSNVSFVAGGCGFIGFTLVSELLKLGHTVVVIDNFSKGNISYLSKLNNPLLHIYNYDLSVDEHCREAFQIASSHGKIVDVWHLAANSDIPAGVNNYQIDLKDTFLTTCRILSTMKDLNLTTFYFASSSAVYGDHGKVFLTENIGPLLPISNYGAMKLASEAVISAASESFLKKSIIFRFPNVVGAPATHGVIFDFIQKLGIDKTALHVLGDGSQRKSYLHVSDLVSAMLHLSRYHHDVKLDIFNIGPIDTGVNVSFIAEQVISRVNKDARIYYGTGNKGWTGDVPQFYYSTEKLQNTGWRPKFSSSEAIIYSINEIALQFGL